MKKKYDIGAGVFFLILSILAYWEIYDLVPVLPSGDYGPELFPKIISIGMGLCAIILIIQGVTMKPEKNEVVIDFSQPGVRRALKLMGIVIVFGALIYFLGFLPAAAVMTATTVYLLGERRTKYIILITAGIVVGVFVIFSLILKVNLPGGILF